MRSDLIFYFFSSILSKLISGLLFILLAREFSKSDFGLYKTAVSFIGIVSIFVNYGLSDLFLYRSSKSRSLNIFYIIFPLYLFNYIASGILIFLLWLFNGSKFFIINIALFIKIFFDWFLDIWIKYFQSLNKFIYISILLAIQSILIAILIFSIFIIKPDIVSFTFLQLLFSVLLFIASLYYFDFYYFFNIKKLKFNIAVLINTLKHSHVFFISSLMSYIYMQSDILMLSVLKGYEDVARYSVATTLIAAMYLIPSVLYNYFLPKLTFNAREKILYKRTLKHYFLINFIISIVIFLGFFFFSKEILLTIYTSKYEDSVFLFKILLLVFLSHSIVFVFGSVLTSTGNQKIRGNIQVLAAITNIVLNLIFIPKFGAEGAAFTTLVTELIILILYTLKSKEVVYGSN